MIFGPDGPTQSLYYTTYANGGQVRRIAFTAQNQAPMAVLSADITSDTAPLTVSFDGSGSSDPDLGDTLTYRWDFGDGSTPIETTNATATHEYSTAGTFAATLSVRDNQGATSAAATLQIMVSNPLSRGAARMRRPLLLSPAAEEPLPYGPLYPADGGADRLTYPLTELAPAFVDT
jgi:PKD repeat protein